jgi:hypothetical protein
LGIFCHAHLVNNLASAAILIRETCQINNISIVYILASESSFWFGIDKPGWLMGSMYMRRRFRIDKPDWLMGSMYMRRRFGIDKPDWLMGSM